MAAYRRIMAAVDLTGDSSTVLARAAELAAQNQAALRLVHVVEFIPMEPLSDSLVPVVQIDERVLASARTRLLALAGDFGLAADAVQVSSGNVKAELLQAARAWQPELIVLGSRERHGLSILVNFTEDTLLHGAPCDVLAVRVR